MDDLERISASAILTRSEVAHILDLPTAKVRRWSEPGSKRPPLLTRAPRGFGANPPTIPLLGLSEAAAMKHLVEERKASPQRLARIVTAAKERDPLAFAREGFFTDGTDIFHLLDGQLERTKDQQQTLREVLGPFLRRVNFQNGVMQSFVVRELPSANVIIDPRFASGRPIVDGDGTPIYAILDELEEGAKAGQIADDFGLPEQVVADVRRNRRWLAPIA